MKNLMKAHRAAQELKLTEMSERTGIHPNQLGDYEARRKVPTLRKVPVLRKHYEMTLEELLEHFVGKEEEE